MAIVITDDKNYANIAKAIRQNAGITDTIKPVNMAVGVRKVYVVGYGEGREVGHGEGYTEGYAQGEAAGGQAGFQQGIGTGIEQRNAEIEPLLDNIITIQESLINGGDLP